MSDLISREELKKKISKLILNWNDKTEYGQARISSYEFVLELIDNAPTVENITVFSEGADEETLEDIKKELKKVLDKLKERNNG